MSNDENRGTAEVVETNLTSSMASSSSSSASATHQPSATAELEPNVAAAEPAPAAAASAAVPSSSSTTTVKVSEDRPPEQLCCPICQDLLDKAVRIQKCGHVFCSLCIRNTFMIQRQSGSKSYLGGHCACPVCLSHGLGKTTKGGARITNIEKELEVESYLQDCVARYKAKLERKKQRQARKQAMQEDGDFSLDYSYSFSPSPTKEPFGSFTTESPISKGKGPVYYAKMKRKDLQQLCRSDFLDDRGTDNELRERHRRFVVMWNAELDCDDVTQRKTPRQLRAAFDALERSSASVTVSAYGFTYKKGDGCTIIQFADNDEQETFNSNFRDLIDDLKKRQEEESATKKMKSSPSSTDEAPLIESAAAASGVAVSEDEPRDIDTNSSSPSMNIDRQALQKSKINDITNQMRPSSQDTSSSSSMDESGSNEVDSMKKKSALSPKSHSVINSTTNSANGDDTPSDEHKTDDDHSSFAQNGANPESTNKDVSVASVPVDELASNNHSMNESSNSSQQQQQHQRFNDPQSQPLSVAGSQTRETQPNVNTYSSSTTPAKSLKRSSGLLIRNSIEHRMAEKARECGITPPSSLGLPIQSAASLSGSQDMDQRKRRRRRGLWTCAACTWRNPSVLNECEMCKSKRELVDFDDDNVNV